MAYLVWYLLIFNSILFRNVFCETEYTAGFSAESEECPDFENKEVLIKLELIPMDGDDDDSPSLMALEGVVDVRNDIEASDMVSVALGRVTDTTSEVMWSFSMKAEDMVKQEDSPWAPAMKSMGIDSCPVKKNEYLVSNFTLAMDCAKDFMNQNYVGKYVCEVRIEDQQKNSKSCHTLGICIAEV